jgi:hypothetical protein
LVASRLPQSAQSDATPPARKRIISTGYANRLRNQYLTAQLSRLLGEFQRASIETLAIKGPVLAAIAYGDPGLRLFADLDLLVRRADLAAAARLLERLDLTADLYDEAAIASGFFNAVEVNFRSRNGIVNVDLHWELSPGFYPFGPGGEELWQRAIEVPLDGASVRTLGHEDHLLYLAVHASRHGWCLLSYVCDIACFVNQVELDWPTLTARASATHCLRMLNVGLLLASELLGTPLPNDVLETARSDARTVARASAVAADLGGNAAPSELQLLRHSLGLISGTRHRARYLATHSFAPTLLDFNFRPLPRPLYPAYYLIRQARIGSGLIRRLSSRIGANRTVGWQSVDR